MRLLVRGRIYLAIAAIVVGYVGYHKISLWNKDRQLKAAKLEKRNIETKTENKAKKIISKSSESKIKEIEGENFKKIDITTGGYIIY